MISKNNNKNFKFHFIAFFHVFELFKVGATKAFRVENEEVRGETLFGLSHIATIFGDGCEEESRKRRAVDNVYNWGLPVHGIDLWISKTPFPSSGNMKCASEYKSGDQFRFGFLNKLI